MSFFTALSGRQKRSNLQTLPEGPPTSPFDPKADMSG